MQIRYPFALLLLLSISGRSAEAQNYKPLTSMPETRAADVSTIDSIIPALYATISGTTGQPRQWQRFLTLFHPNAHMVPMRCGTEKCIAQYMSPQEYRERADSLLVSLGFQERELVRRTERFGPMAHAYSSYASFRQGETAPFSRGINSIQLFWNGTRWWILSIVWNDERPDTPLPPEYAGTQ